LNLHEFPPGFRVMSDLNVHAQFFYAI
jgi:hypothetical protein